MTAKIKITVADLEAAIEVQNRINKGLFVTERQKRNHHLVCLRYQIKDLDCHFD